MSVRERRQGQRRNRRSSLLVIYRENRADLVSMQWESIQVLIWINWSTSVSGSHEH